MGGRMGHTLTNKELLTVCILAFILLLMLYIWFVYRPIKSEIKTYDTTELAEDYEAEQLIYAQIMEMKAAMESEDEYTTAKIEIYNNQKSELKLLNDILAAAEDFSLSFENPVADGKLVRRNARISFSATSYRSAEKIIGEVNDSELLCIIRNLNISPGSGQDSLESGDVNVTMTATFYETLYGATTTEGVQNLEPEISTEEDTTEE